MDKGGKIKSTIKKITSKEVEAEIINAGTLQRRRSPILLNNSFDEVPQMFVNCLAKNTYIRPHKHPNSYQIEYFSIIYGEGMVVLFDDEGVVIDKFTLSHGNIVLVKIPCNIYHTVLTNTGCAFLEIRNHAYKRQIDKEFAGWSPPEDSALADSYYEKLVSINKGESCVIE